jgi:hypothetical protein
MIDLLVTGVRGDGKPLILKNISWEEAVNITTKHPRWKITISPDPVHTRPGPAWDEEPQ